MQLNDHLFAVEVPKHEKYRTRSWHIMNKTQAMPLGTVEWQTSWRCYIFSPVACTVYDAGCLAAISKFLQEQTAAQRAAAKQRKADSA